jgi:hypothetical protein
MLPRGTDTTNCAARPRSCTRAQTYRAANSARNAPNHYTRASRAAARSTFNSGVSENQAGRWEMLAHRTRQLAQITLADLCVHEYLKRGDKPRTSASARLLSCYEHAATLAPRRCRGATAHVCHSRSTCKWQAHASGGLERLNELMRIAVQCTSRSIQSHTHAHSHSPAAICRAPPMVPATTACRAWPCY